MSNLAVSELAKLNPCHTWLGGEFRQPRHTSPYLAEPILGEVRKGGGIPYQKEVKPSVGEAIVGGCVPRRRTFLYTAAARCRLKNRQQVSSGRKAPSMPFPCWQERQGRETASSNLTKTVLIFANGKEISQNR